MTIAFRRGRVINPVVTAELPDPSTSVFGPVAAGLMGLFDEVADPIHFKTNNEARSA